MNDLRAPAAADELPDSLTLDEAFRAAFYMVGLLLLKYLHSDLARWDD